MGALDRIGLGYGTQWKGLDPKGRARSAIYADWDAPESEWQWNSEAGMKLPPQKTVRPGMIDDLLALPDVVTLGRGPKISREASARTQALDEALRKEANIGPPERWSDYLAEAGGTMAAQIPTPGGELGIANKASKFLGPLSRAIKRIPKPVRKVVGGIPEWFMPTIQPTPSNLAVGTAAGAAMGKYLPELAAQFGSNSDDIWDHAYKGALEYKNATPEERKHMLPPEILMEIAQHLDPQPEEAEGPAENFQGEDEFLDELLGGSGSIGEPTNEEVPAMAKGGKVKPPTGVHPRMKLRQRLEDLAREAGVEGTGKEVLPAEPSTTVPTLEDLKASIERPAEPSSTNFEGPTVSRRDVLSGIASMASPIKLDPMALLGGDSDLEAGLDAARKAVEIGKTLSTPKAGAMSKAALARVLKEVYETVVHTSDEGMMLDAADLADAIPGAGDAGLGSYIRDWYEGFDDPNLDPSGKWMEEKAVEFEKRLGEFAKQQGLIHRPGRLETVPDVENGPEFDTEHSVDPTFTEPMPGGKRLLDNMIELSKTAGPPEWNTKLARLRDYLGDRADAALTESYMSEEPSALMDEALHYAGFTDEGHDAWNQFHDMLDEHFLQYGHVDDWINADPKLREEYSLIENQLHDIPSESPEGQKLLERKMEIEREIWPGYRGNYPETWPEE